MGRQPAAHWNAVRDVCDENPGAWVLVTDRGHNAWVTKIRNGRIVAFSPAGAYDAMVRQGNGLRGALFVRRIPDEEKESTSGT
jgi:hypothetical protein